MGLFDMFQGDKTGNQDGMEPHFAFAASLLYLMGADGEYDNEELGHFLSIIDGKSKGGMIYIGGDNDDLLEKTIAYISKNCLDIFLKEAIPSLTDAQKMCILVNLIDFSLSDGTAVIEEQIMLKKFLNAFGVSEDRFRPFFEVIALKNDLSVFTNHTHTKNLLSKVELTNFYS
ncbi:Tellurite resistance protein TerB [Bacillus thuringiensis]|uniref:Tellurite resistance protein TerB n=1 Tax=Bacillus thuringiensis TaxID=1428 RepID=A0A9X7C1E4_BACTU|nr:TerB family tellurite resistance protein [Bacillus thuringiensis]PGH85799.1 Tellurite resistance protein TerB [Bacillus thuringiensis]